MGSSGNIMEPDELNSIKIKISITETEDFMEGELERTKNARTVEAIRDVLPINGKANNYKNDQIYISNFRLKLGREKATKTAVKGDISYWPMSGAICFFRADIEPYSEVNHLGKITSNIQLLEKVQSGTRLTIELIEE